MKKCEYRWLKAIEAREKKQRKLVNKARKQLPKEQWEAVRMHWLGGLID